MGKYVCIHGHFYQPPRENAWLEKIELQDSAHPYHDWNERINAECYLANTASRILNEEGVIKNIVSNYAKISFNFGPTLLSWMEAVAPDTYQAILEADRQSIKNFNGHGSALAQVYNHVIMPLANRRDKETQVIWGIKDFEYRFRRKPEGMWLSETAADTETLEVLAEHDIKFTILAPGQAWQVRKIGGESWTDVSDLSVDPRRPYVCNLPSGRSIALFFYDGNISQAVAFSGLLNNGKEFAKKLLAGFDEDPEGNQLVHIATDGESYGHHHKHGDMALAYCLDDIENGDEAELTNYGAYLEAFPPQYEAQIVENSSWSCVHGVGRWKEDCGCHTGGHPGWSQQWRAPLREALDWVRDQLTEVFEKEGEKLFHDIWSARNGYIEIILNRSEENLTRFLEGITFEGTKKNHAARLLEMQRHVLLMYTSCGWFFDEVSGIETIQVMQYACRAIQLANRIGLDMEPEFLRILNTAQSNMPEYDSAAEIYKKQVIPTRLSLQRVGMHYAVASVFEDDAKGVPVFNYRTQNEFFERREAGVQKLAVGITEIVSKVTLSKRRFTFAVLYLGQHNIIGNISIDMEKQTFENMQEEVVEAFEESRLGDVIGLMQTYFGPEKYTIWHLFKDEKRKVLEGIMAHNMQQIENSFRRTYDADYQLLNALKNDQIPIPKAYQTTLEFVHNVDLVRCFKQDQIDLEELRRITDEFKKWDLRPDDNLSLSKYAGQSVYKALLNFSEDEHNMEHLKTINQYFDLLDLLNLNLDLYRCQNLYFQISKRNSTLFKDYLQDENWKQQFSRLGEHLGVKVE